MATEAHVAEGTHATKPKPNASGFVVRTISTVVMLLLFVAVMWGGHIPCAILMFTFQAMIVRELFTLARNVHEDMSLPLFRTQQWYFFIVATFYLYGRFVRQNFVFNFVSMAASGRSGTFLAWLLRRHIIISYAMYTLGIVLFVLLLKPGKYQYQFRQFAWTHLIVFFTVVPSTFFVPLMFEGLVWFFLPCALIIVNDIMAYLAGKCFGRTPLIQLSPKKTWEGFIGGAIGTMASSFALAWVFAQFEWMFCPREELAFGALHCEPSEQFVPTEYHLTDLWEVLPDPLVEEMRSALAVLPEHFRDYFAGITWTCMPCQMHALMLALFASMIGPFGGFFASGFKRAMGVKDFGDSIPGHGGVTDRFDCQMLMAVFSYLYFHTYIAKDDLEDDIMARMSTLDASKRLVVFQRLGKLLVADNALPPEWLDALAWAR